MQLQRRIAMRVIEQGLDPKIPCVLDKHGNIRQKPKKELRVTTELENQSIQPIVETSTIEEHVKLSDDLHESLETSGVSDDETVVLTDELTPPVVKTVKNKFTKKK